MERIISTIQNMKVVKLLPVFVLIIGLWSCEDLLNVEAEGAISGDVLTDEATIQEALIGAYYSFTGINDGSAGGELFGGDFMLIPELLIRQQSIELQWDDVNGPTYADFAAKDVLAVNTEVETNWRRAYEVINLVNSILENIDNVEDASVRSRIQGEALAMRGMLYFEMVRLWGPQFGSTSSSDLSVPLILSSFNAISEIVTPTLATVEAVYNQAETDLTNASTLLQPLGQNGVFIGYYTCQAYLMRLALQKNDYDAAEDYADNIIASNQFQLTNTPVAAFNNATNSSEDIFAIQQTFANNTGDLTTGTGLTYFYSSISGNGVGAFRILGNSLYDDFIVVNGPQFYGSDLRATIDSVTSQDTGLGDITGAFYRHITSTVTLSPSKFGSAENVLPILRLAEIYLSRAEARMEENFPAIDQGAIDDLNTVRTRAGLSILQVSDFTDSFQLRDSIVIERKRELLYEGTLFHDLKRWSENGYFVSIGNDGSDPTDDRFVLPIPQAEMDTWTD